MKLRKNKQEGINMGKNKRIKALLTAVIAAAAPVTAQLQPASALEIVLSRPDILTLFGDVNYDGTVGVSDAVQLYRYLLGQSDEMGNWKNADLSGDGDISVFDLVFLRKQLVDDEDAIGGKLKINVVDMMTGEPVDADIDVIGLCDDSYFDLGNFTFEPGGTVNLSGLPTNGEYEYMFDISGLPEGYSDNFAAGPHYVKFSFEEGVEDDELTVRVLADDTECNMKLNLFDWTKGISEGDYGLFTITDKEGNPYYQDINNVDFALPDGEYHIEFKPFDLPVQIITEDSEYADELKELFPDISFNDSATGFDFTVTNGEADRELRIDFGSIDLPEEYSELFGTLTDGSINAEDLFSKGIDAYKEQLGISDDPEADAIDWEELKDLTQELFSGTDPAEGSIDDVLSELLGE